MKAFVALLFIWILPDWACLAQTLRITAFDRAGDLRWTNLLCTTEPVYEVLQAMSPSGPWNHLAFATNQTSLVVSNPSAPGASFFKLTWVHDAPLEFDYTFDEYQFGYGFSITTVTGRLSINLTGPPGTRSFFPTEYYDPSTSRHSIGSAPLVGPAYSGDGTSLRVYLKLGVEAEGAMYLNGTLERSIVDGRCVYTGYAGEVYEVGFQTLGLGTFVATRPP